MYLFVHSDTAVIIHNSVLFDILHLYLNYIIINKI